jgi:hypothetical protein
MSIAVTDMPKLKKPKKPATSSVASPTYAAPPPMGDPLYSDSDVTRLKARAASSARMGGDRAVSSAANMSGGVTNPAFALLAQRARTGATTQGINAGADIDLNARRENADYGLRNQAMAIEGSRLGLAENADSREAQMFLIQKILAQLGLAGAQRQNAVEAIQQPQIEAAASGQGGGGNGTGLFNQVPYGSNPMFSVGRARPGQSTSGSGAMSWR